MACSARVLRLLHPKRLELARYEEQYQHECLVLLIPQLDHLSVIQHETILATIGIFRMSEQISDLTLDPQCHLVPGVFAHFSTRRSSSTDLGGLSEASFYSFVRADIRMAIVGRCGTRLQVGAWPLDESSPQTDADWTHRVTWLLVHCINLCYGSNDAAVMPATELDRLVDDWKASISGTFEPYVHEDLERESFPLVRFLAPWHVVGLQFYHACKILLSMQRPFSPDNGSLLDFNRSLRC